MLHYIKAIYSGLSNKNSRSTMAIVVQNNVRVGLLISVFDELLLVMKHVFR